MGFFVFEKTRIPISITELIFRLVVIYFPRLASHVDIPFHFDLRISFYLACNFLIFVCKLLSVYFFVWLELGSDDLEFFFLFGL